MAKATRIEPRTRAFIAALEDLKKHNKMPTNVQLAKVLGVKSDTTISEIRGKRQNIQPDQWYRFKEYYDAEVSDDFDFNQVETGYMLLYEGEEPKKIDKKAPLLPDNIDAVELLKLIHTNLIETRHTVELNQALAKANLYQSAKLESIATQGTHRRILEGLNKVTAKIFEEMHHESNQTSDVD